MSYDIAFWRYEDSLEHDHLADRMGLPTKELERTHVRISTNQMSGHRSPIQFVGRNLTQKQKDSIWDWCMLHSEDVPPWVFDDDGTKVYRGFAKATVDGGRARGDGIDPGCR